MKFGKWYELEHLNGSEDGFEDQTATVNLLFRPTGAITHFTNRKFWLLHFLNNLKDNFWVAHSFDKNFDVLYNVCSSSCHRLPEWYCYHALIMLLYSLQL